MMWLGFHSESYTPKPMYSSLSLKSAYLCREEGNVYIIKENQFPCSHNTSDTKYEFFTPNKFSFFCGHQLGVNLTQL